MGTILWLAILGLPLFFAMNFIHMFFAQYVYRINKYDINEIGFIGTLGITTSVFLTMFVASIVLANININMHRYLMDNYGMIPNLVLGYIISIFIYSGIIKLMLLLKK